MKPSTAFLVGESVILGDVCYTKQSQQTPVAGNISTAEVWTDGNNQQYEPTLAFTEGLSEPAFNAVQL